MSPLLKRHLECSSRVQMWAAVGVAILAITASAAAGVAVDIAYDTASEARDSTRVQCERTRAFAPHLLTDYRARAVLPPELLAEYAATIPKSCPE